MNLTDQSTLPESRNERRRRLTDEKISAAVLKMALEQGPQSITFSGIAAESGVAKTTLYRRYQSREELLEGVAQHFSSIPENSDEAPTTPEGLAAMLRLGVDTLEKHIGMRAVGALLASQDEFLLNLREKLFAPQIVNAIDYFNRAVEAGILRDDVDYSLIVDLIYGGMIMHSARHHEVGHSWADAVVDLIWPLISKQAATQER